MMKKQLIFLLGLLVLSMVIQKSFTMFLNESFKFALIQKAYADDDGDGVDGHLYLDRLDAVGGRGFDFAVLDRSAGVIDVGFAGDEEVLESSAGTGGLDGNLDPRVDAVKFLSHGYGDGVDCAAAGNLDGTGETGFIDIAGSGGKYKDGHGDNQTQDDDSAKIHCVLLVGFLRCSCM